MSQKRDQNKHKKFLSPIVFILGFGLLARLISINQSLWLDEATTASVSSMSYSQILTKFSPGDFHPPFYYFLSKFVVSLIGESEISLRLVSVITGVLTIYLVYKIVKLVANKKTASVAAILTASSPLLIYYSQEARMYSLAAFLVILLIYFWFEAVYGKAKNWIYFSCLLPFIAATDYLAIFVVVPIWLVTFLKYKIQIKHLMLAHIPLFIFSIIYAPLFISQLSSAQNVHSSGSLWWVALGPTSVKNIALVFVKFLIGRISFDNKLVYGVIISSLLVYTSVFVAKAKSLKALFFFSWLFMPILVLTVVGLFIPVVTYFRFLFCLPALYILVALGLDKFNKKKFIIFFSIFLFVNIICSSIYLFTPKFQREDWRGFSNMVRAEKNLPQQVIFVTNSQMEAYNYYNPGLLSVSYQNFDKNAKTIWLMRYVQDVFDPKDLAREKVEQSGYTKVSEFNFNGVVVWKYQSI